MTDISKMMCGAILVSIPTIELGGVFLLSNLSGTHKGTPLTGFQKSMFRAGHAHAGVILILALLVQFMCDAVEKGDTIIWFARVGTPMSSLLISGGFFAAAAGKGRTSPNQWIKLIYVGALLLAGALLTIGITLLQD